MPTYCFRGDDGSLVELSMTVAELLRRRQDDGSIEHDGRTLRRDVAAEHAASVGSSAGWPIWSDAAAVHPDQVAGVRRDLERHGVHVDFDRWGRPRLEDAAHRRAVLRRMGLRDRMGYD